MLELVYWVPTFLLVISLLYCCNLWQLFCIFLLHCLRRQVPRQYGEVVLALQEDLPVPPYFCLACFVPHVFVTYIVSVPVMMVNLSHDICTYRTLIFEFTSPRSMASNEE